MSITLKGLGSAVDSVNGKKGIVVLSPEDLGADSAGAASAVIVQHEAAADPHPQYLTENEADAKYALIGSGGTGGDPAGTAAALLAAHEAAADPHPQYLTKSEGDALYQPIGSGGGTSEMIRTPVAVAPLTGATEFPVDGTLQASPYAPLYSADTREFREFQIDTAAGDFTAPISVAQVNADTWVISPAIPDSTDLKWRCRDKSAKGDYSDWSEPQSFKTFDIYVVTPTIVSPTEGEVVAERDQPITSSEFQIVNAIDTHAASYWTIKDNLGAVVYQTGRDTVNLTSWQPPAGVIVDGESMSVEVRYESTGGVVSEAGARGFVGVGVGYGKYLICGGGPQTGLPPSARFYGVDVETLVQIEPSSYPSFPEVYSVAMTNSHAFFGGSVPPYIESYIRVGDSFTKNNASVPAQTKEVNAISVSNDSTMLALGLSTGSAKVLKNVNGVYVENLVSLDLPPSGSVGAVAFSPDGVYFCCTQSTTPFLLIYKRQSDGNYARQPNPSTLPTGAVRGIVFSPDGLRLAVTHANSPRITVYNVDTTTDTFTKIANPAELPAGNGWGASFSSDGRYLAVAHENTPFITVYDAVGGTLVKLPNPTSLPGGVGFSCAFSQDGMLAVGGGGTPPLRIYKIDNGQLLNIPAQYSDINGRGVAFWPSPLHPANP